MENQIGYVQGVQILSDKSNLLILPNQNWFICDRKYPLRGDILGVLTHTTAWDRHWGGDETLKLFLVYVAWPLLS